MAKNKDILKYALENDIDVDTAYDVINNFFLYFREHLGSETFPDIRIKRLGLFTPAISRIKNNIRNLDRLYEKGGISKDKYKCKKELLINYLKEYEKS
jgi:hypothetical protein